MAQGEVRRSEASNRVTLGRGAGRWSILLSIGVSCAGLISCLYGVSYYCRDELETVAQGDVRSEYRRGLEFRNQNRLSIEIGRCIGVGVL